jgi:hypothetical protein
VPFHGSRLVVQPEYEPTFRAQGIASPADAAAKWAPGDGERSRVADIRIPHAGTTAHLFIKTYHYPGLDRLRTLFIPARVRREYENLVGLSKLGLRVPRAVAYGETRVFGFLADSFVATGRSRTRSTSASSPSTRRSPPSRSRAGRSAVN